MSSTLCFNEKILHLHLNSSYMTGDIYNRSPSVESENTIENKHVASLAFSIEIIMYKYTVKPQIPCLD